MERCQRISQRPRRRICADSRARHRARDLAADCEREGIRQILRERLARHFVVNAQVIELHFLPRDERRTVVVHRQLHRTAVAVLHLRKERIHIAQVRYACRVRFPISRPGKRPEIRTIPDERGVRLLEEKIHHPPRRHLPAEAQSRVLEMGQGQCRARRPLRHRDVLHAEIQRRHTRRPCIEKACENPEAPARSRARRVVFADSHLAARRARVHVHLVVAAIDAPARKRPRHSRRGKRFSVNPRARRRPIIIRRAPDGQAHNREPICTHCVLPDCWIHPQAKLQISRRAIAKRHRCLRER